MKAWRHWLQLHSGPQEAYYTGVRIYRTSAQAFDGVIPLLSLLYQLLVVDVFTIALQLDLSLLNWVMLVVAWLPLDGLQDRQHLTARSLRFR